MGSGSGSGNRERGGLIFGDTMNRSFARQGTGSPRGVFGVYSEADSSIHDNEIRAQFEVQ